MTSFWIELHGDIVDWGLDLGKRSNPLTACVSNLDHTKMETVPYLDLRAQYRPLRSSVERIGGDL